MVKGITLHSMQDRKLVYLGKKAVVLAVNEATQQVIIERDDQPIFIRNFPELLNDIIAGKVSFVQDLVPCSNTNALTVAQRVEIQRRERYFYAMLAKKHPTVGVEKLIEDIQREIGDTIGYANSTLCKHFKRFVEDGYSAVPQVLGTARKKPTQLSQDVEKLVWKYLYKHHLKENGISVDATQRLMSSEYEATGYGKREDAPCSKTLMRRVKSLGPYERDRLRYGESYAKNKYRSKLHVYDLDIPLDRAELDMAHFNVGIVKYINNKKYFRGTISVALVFDVGTASLLGYALQVGKNKESSSYVVASLYHAVSEKPDPTYKQHGRIRLAVMDAGVAYRAETTRLFMKKMNSIFEITEVRKPWSKPFVENFVNRLRLEFFQGLEGYCGPFDPSRYSDANIKKEAKYTLEQFQQKFANYIRDYHNTAQERLGGLTPNEAWEKGTRIYPVMKISDCTELRKFKGLKTTVKYNLQYGTTFDYQFFNSSELKAMYEEYVIATGKTEMQLTMLVDLNDASSISVVVPEVINPTPKQITLVDVPNTKRSSQGKSFNELSVIEGRCEQIDGATVFVDDDILSGYRASPTHADVIDITFAENRKLNDYEVENEVDDILSKSGFRSPENNESIVEQEQKYSNVSYFDDVENEDLGVNMNE